MTNFELRTNVERRTPNVGGGVERRIRNDEFGFRISAFGLAFSLLLLASSLFADHGFVDRETRTRIDYQSGLVYYESWVEGYYDGVTKVESLDTYLAHLSENTLTHSWQDAVQQQQLSEDLAFDRNGLIPEINLPTLPLFGSGSKIDIQGSDRITLGGSNMVVTGSSGDTSSSFLPQLKMEQALKINLNGTIGDKTKIFLDHDSERQFESKDKISLTYTGSEDDVVQSIEAGDTRLAIPSTAYTGDLPAHNGLFGVSAQGKVGGVDLYGVAAREQSETQTQEFHAQKQLHLDTIRDWEYVRFTRFRLDTVALPEVRDLHVYVDDANPSNNNNTIRCLSTVFPDRPDSIPTSWEYDRKIGDFDIQSPNTNFIVSSDNKYIQFVTPIMDNYAIGVTYKVVRGPGDTLQVGGTKWQDSLLVLKLLKPFSSDTASLTWDLELKNMYSLGAKDVKIDSIILYRQLAGDPQAKAADDNGVSFLHFVGLDPNNRGTVEWPQFDAVNGYLICDSLHPFVNRSLTAPDSIYELRTPSSYTNWRYFFYIKYTAGAESYNLGVTNLIENSEKVTVDGTVWTKDVDYTINYTTGELTMKREIPPNSDVSVTYEYTPFLSLSEKTILGARAEWSFLDNGKLGSSIFYRSEDIPGEDKPSLGAEPFQRTVAETDLGYDLSSDFVTSLLGRLPLVRAEAPTTFHIGGEGAISMPNPNTRNAAYLDDFEASTVTRDMGNVYRTWQLCSTPDGKETADFAHTRLKWFNPVTRIPKESIFGSDIGTEAKDPVQFMRIFFTPDNLNSWAGIMTCPSTLGMDVSDLENVEAVLRTRHNHGLIHVTLAMVIDEDAPRRRKDGRIVGMGHDDTEDKSNPLNGVLDVGEDLGIDGIPGKDETWDSLSGDDGNDDYNTRDADKDSTANPDGTEGNGILDHEDLMGTGWTTHNAYYEYTFRFDDTIAVKPLYNGWKTLRIALTDPVRSKVVGGPRLQEIRVARIWFDSFPAPDTIDLYSLAVVGSKWRNPTVVKAFPGASDVDTLAEHIRTSLISKQTDPNYYSPFAVQKDPVTGTTILEASLKLDYNNLRPGHRGIVRKTDIEDEDYRDYRQLHVYVHNDVTNNPDFFLQIGSDSLNYYEYRQTIGNAVAVAGYPGWFEVQINLDTFTVINYELGSQRDSVTRLDSYTIAGYPSLATVRYMAMGIENASPEGITGYIWVDDIRLTGPRADPGFGFTSSASLRLSDLGDLNVSYRYDDPNFRRFSEGRGVKTGGYSNTLGFGADVNLERFFPASWGLSLPFNYSYSSARTIPKYSSLYPDLRLLARQIAEETGSGKSNSWGISAHKSSSTNSFLRYTLDALTYSFRHSAGASSSLLDSTTSNSNSHNLGWSVSPDLKFKIGETEISYFPQSVHLSGSLSDSRSPHQHRDSVGVPWVSIPADSSHAASYEFGADYSPVSDLSFSYSFSADRDLNDPQNLRGVSWLNVGQESGRDATFSASYSLDIGSYLSPKADFDGHYTEDRPRLAEHYGNLINTENGGTLDLSSDFDLPEALSALGKLRNEERDSTAKAGSPQWLLMQLEKSDEYFSPLDLSYSFDRSSNYTSLPRRPPWWYQLGFSDALDSTYTSTSLSSITRQMGTEFSGSTDLRFKVFDAHLRYSRNWDRDVSGFSPTGNISTTWPDISLSISKVEALFPKFLTTSSVSSNYQSRSDFTGTYSAGTDTFEHLNRHYSNSTTFSPLLSWQATWTNKMTSTFSASYTNSQDMLYVMAESASTSRSQNWSYSLSVGYSFSAPSGIKLPGLRKLKFDSDLGLSLGLNYAKTYAVGYNVNGDSTVQTDAEDIGGTVSLSYRFSRSIEAGLNSGYSTHRDIQHVLNTRTTDLSVWVLFKF